MSVILASESVVLDARNPAQSGEFNVGGSASGPVLLMFVVRGLAAATNLDVKLERKSGTAWNDAGPVKAGTGQIANGVYYARVPQTGTAAGTLRLAMTSSGAGQVDVFAIDGATKNPWALSGHRLDALGAAAAAQIPALQHGLELALMGTLAEKSRSRTGGPQPPAPTRNSGPATHLPASLLQYLLGNRIDYASVPAPAMQTIATSVHMTVPQLQDHIDQLNALSDVALELAGQTVSQGSLGAGTSALTICGFWSTHIDPGPCQTNPQGDINSVCTVTDVDVCSTIDVHY
jgi:hypothetical protein